LRNKHNQINGMSTKMKVALASDHAGFKMKQEILEWLMQNNVDFKDFGTFSTDAVDYPDFAHPMAKALENNEFHYGISLCGSGNGINMAANKHQGIRSAICWDVELAYLARLHNDANICALPARFISVEKAIQIVEKFLTTGFEGGRHIKRIEKIRLNN